MPDTCDSSSHCPSRLLLIEFPDRAHLDTSYARRWKLRGHLDGLVEVSGVDEKKSANLLLRLGKGTVGHRHLAVPGPQGHGNLDWLDRSHSMLRPSLSGELK